MLHLHGGGFTQFYEARGPVGQRFIRWVLNRASEVVVLTESWRRELTVIKGNDRALTVVMNPVRLSVERPGRNGRSLVHILFLGRIDERKGVFDLLECARRLTPEVPSLRFTLCGDGQLEQARGIIRRNGLEHRVSLPGWVADPDSYLSEADIFVLPSYFEGLPMSILEAESWGLPVIATRVGGIPEIVRDGESGFLIEPGDIDSLADRLKRLAQDESLRNRMGHHGYTIVREQCREEVVARQLAKIYERLCQISPSSG